MTNARTADDDHLGGGAASRRSFRSSSRLAWSVARSLIHSSMFDATHAVAIGEHFKAIDEDVMP